VDGDGRLRVRVGCWQYWVADAVRCVLLATSKCMCKCTLLPFTIPPFTRTHTHTHTHTPHLIDEEDARDDVCLTLLPPLPNLAIYLFPHLRADFPRIASKQREESLHGSKRRLGGGMRA
jgi:hypothetical protein